MTIERRVRIIADCDPQNPRTEWDCNVGRMICWHSRYNLGDEHSYDSDTFMRELACENHEGLEEILEHLENEVHDELWNSSYIRGITQFDDRCKYVDGLIRPLIDELIENSIREGYVILPVYMYDHSGIALSTGGFGCSWDSGQVGWIVCDQETIDKEWDGDRDKAEKALESEVEVYSDYVNGSVYGFVAEQREQHEDTDEADYADDDEWEEVDSCWGFYGNDEDTNGIKDSVGSDFADAEFIWE